MADLMARLLSLTEQHGGNGLGLQGAVDVGPQNYLWMPRRQAPSILARSFSRVEPRLLAGDSEQEAKRIRIFTSDQECVEGLG